MVVATGTATMNPDHINSSSNNSCNNHNTDHQKQFSDIYIRTSWIDAGIALEQIEKVKTINDFINFIQN